MGGSYGILIRCLMFIPPGYSYERPRLYYPALGSSGKNNRQSKPNTDAIFFAVSTEGRRRPFSMKLYICGQIPIAFAAPVWELYLAFLTSFSHSRKSKSSFVAVYFLL